MKFLFNLLKFLAGILTGAVLFVCVLIIFLGPRPNFFAYIALPCIVLGLIFAAKRKKRFFVTVTLLAFAGLAGFSLYVCHKAEYEHRMFPVIAYPNRVALTSSPPGAKYFELSTGLEIMHVGGAPSYVYYKSTGKIMATLKGFPELKLYAEIREGTKELHFDFKRAYIRLKRPKAPLRRAIMAGKVQEGMNEEEKIIAVGYE